MSQIVNLTPHPITIVDDHGNVLCELPASGTVARLETRSLRDEPLRSGGVEIPTTTCESGTVTGMPPPAPDTYHVVSTLVRNASPQRDNLLVPAEQVRDEHGRLIGCRSLGRQPSDQTDAT